ncbi:MAG: YidC/Oxa1 family insertase periplasmic-domain containing protein [Mariniblastus sp.]
MNSGRALTFILLSSMFMMSAILLQTVFAPKKPVVDGEGVVAEGDLNPGETQEPDTENPDAKNGESGDASESAVATGDDADSASATPAEESKRIAKDEFISLGSLAADGSDRYLVTLNKRGGTVRRIELNFRDRRGDFKYRDITFEGGFLGSLECLDKPTGEPPAVEGEPAPTAGCQVRVVGKGTPAEVAGVKVGDIITAINGEAIMDVADFEKFLDKKTKPNTSIQLSVKRNGNSQTFNVDLTHKPISIISPDSGLVDPDFDYPESFVTSLIQPTDFDKRWPDLDSAMRDSNWEIEESTEQHTVGFKFELSPASLKNLGIAGPITIFKRYKMPVLTADEAASLDTRSFHLDFEIEVQNGSDVAQELALEIDGPTGTSAETWWYANKIHGDTTAFFSMAGARDIVGASSSDSFVFFGCPDIVKEIQRTLPKPHYVCSPATNDEADRELVFVGVDSHYFNVSLLPVMPEGELFKTQSVTASVVGTATSIPVIPKNTRLQKLVDCTFQLNAPVSLEPGGSYKQTFNMFVGPKEKVLLKHYGLSDTRTFGWFGWCSMVLLWILDIFYYITGQFSYGLAIIMLTVMVRCLMIPFSRKAALNAQMMQHLQPQMKEIAAKYTDPMERSAEQRKLYAKYNFNPLGGCFMMFFQLPIFYGLYKALNVDIALRDQPLIPGMSWCSNLAAPDQLMYWKDWMPTWLGDETGYLGPYFNILPIITMVLFIAQQKLFTPPPTDDQQKMMQKVMTYAMLFMGILFFKVPAGLCLYFITSSLWGIIERKMLPKPVLNTEKLGLVTGDTKAQKKLNRAAEAKEKQREEEAAQRKLRNAERKKKLNKR